MEEVLKKGAQANKNWEKALLGRAVIGGLSLPIVFAFFRRGGLGQTVDPTLDYQPVD